MSKFTNAIYRFFANIGREIDRFIRTVPTTNARILVTLGLAIGTGLRYWGIIGTGAWEPKLDWLVFLVTMSGIDAIQFTQKRKTAWHPAELPENKTNESSISNEEKG